MCAVSTNTFFFMFLHFMTVDAARGRVTPFSQIIWNQFTPRHKKALFFPGTEREAASRGRLLWCKGLVAAFLAPPVCYSESRP